MSEAPLKEHSAELSELAKPRFLARMSEAPLKGDGEVIVRHFENGFLARMSEAPLKGLLLSGLLAHGLRFPRSNE